LLGEIIDSLPEELRREYLSTERGTVVQGIMKLIVARHLWSKGLRHITFERPSHLHGSMIYIDVYASDSNICVECEFKPSRKGVIERGGEIRQAVPGAKYVLAVHDMMGWYAGKFVGLADEVWVVCRNGLVLTPSEWVEWRKSYITEPLNIGKLTLLANCLEKSRALLEGWGEMDEKLRMDVMGWWRSLAKAALSMETIHDIPIKTPLARYIEFEKKLVEGLEGEIIGELLEVMNRLVQLTMPYTLRMKDGALEFGIDMDLFEWLGHKDYPADVDNYNLFLKLYKLELNVLADHMRTNWRRLEDEDVPALAQLRQQFEKGKISITNQKLLEMLLEWKQDEKASSQA